MTPTRTHRKTLRHIVLLIAALVAVIAVVLGKKKKTA